MIRFFFEVAIASLKEQLWKIKNFSCWTCSLLIYEDMDIDAIEERFIDLVVEIFSFDRVALFFVKHRKGMLQGKLCKGFEPETIRFS